MSGEIFRESGSGLAFVGDFEGLYKESPDPWGQSGTRADNAAYYRFSRQRLAAMLQSHVGSHPGWRLEIGCGHGYAMHEFAKAIGGGWTGIDISPSAIETAKALFPGSAGFLVGDICGALPLPPSSLGRYDVTILSQMLWYILEKLDAAIINAMRLTSVGGMVIIQQAFLREQLYGRSIIDGFDGAIRYLIGRFPELRLIEARFDDSRLHPYDDGILIFRKVRNPQ